MQLTATKTVTPFSVAPQVVRARFGGTQAEPPAKEAKPAKPKGYLKRQIEHYGFWGFVGILGIHVLILLPPVHMALDQIPGYSKFFSSGKVRVKSLDTYDALDEFTRKLPEGNFEVLRDTSDTGEIKTTITKKK